MKLIKREINIKISPREDGGIRICSNELPGMILSGNNQEAVLKDLGTAIIELSRYKLRGGHGCDWNCTHADRICAISECQQLGHCKDMPKPKEVS